LLVLLHLAGAVTLLLWAVRMVRTGVERAYGAALERTLKGARGGRLRPVALGALVAMILQSATAVGVLAAGFAAGGLLAAGPAMAMLLGADLGSALVVQVLSLDLSWLMPILLTAGGWMFLKGSGRGIKQTGRILMGVGLVLVSLQMIGEATAPLRDSQALPAVVGYLSSDLITCFLLGALFAWAVHSSIAAVLLIASMAAQHILPVEPAVAIVLGANLGGALIAVGLTRAAVPAARRVPLGNLVFRGVGAVIALALLGAVEPPLDFLSSDPAQQVVFAHVLFNLAVVILFLPLTGPLEPLRHGVLPDASSAAAEAGDLLAARVSLLDRSLLHTPRLALASATRELLRTSEIVEVMLRPVMELFGAEL
jgi:phosphate:Na+ symporter